MTCTRRPLPRHPYAHIEWVMGLVRVPAWLYPPEFRRPDLCKCVFCHVVDGSRCCMDDDASQLCLGCPATPTPPRVTHTVHPMHAPAPELLAASRRARG